VARGRPGALVIDHRDGGCGGDGPVRLSGGGQHGAADRGDTEQGDDTTEERGQL
jgi:hypothetical protein